VVAEQGLGCASLPECFRAWLHCSKDQSLVTKHTHVQYMTSLVSHSCAANHAAGLRSICTSYETEMTPEDLLCSS